MSVAFCTEGKPPPVILSIAGHDPSGAAGVQADLETFHALDCRGASLITALTAQNTAEFVAFQPQDETAFLLQAEVLLRDMRFSACKIGMLASPGIASCVAGLLRQLAPIPVVLDPVTHTGTGVVVADAKLRDIIARELLPYVTVLTPNSREALELSTQNEAAAAAARLLELGAANVLITGADDDRPTVVNRLYRADAEPLDFEYERLPHRYHGSGCTLSAAIAAGLGQGLDTLTAVQRAQDFTWSALRRAIRLGRDQFHPTRTA